MSKSNLELFKQAISEGLSNKLDSVANSCTEEIVYSEKHNLSMRTIVYGKIGTKQALSPKMKRVIAIIVAAALLLTSCGIIFHNEIREIIEDFFASITFSEGEYNTKTIEDVYELTYLPKGYILEEEKITSIRASYKFINEKGETIWFEQRILQETDFVIDSESGYSKIVDIDNYDIYYRNTDTYHCYVWRDDKYSFKINSATFLSNEEMVLVLNGITIK